MPRTQRPWFRAKTYGWGWGLPLTWQGWVVLASFGLAMVAGSLLLPPDRHPGAFIGVTFGATAALVAICWVTGEPPGSRNGRSSR